MIEIILLLACCCFIFIVVLAGWFLNRGEEGDECKGKDKNGTYEIDEDLKCVLKSCDTGYYKSGKECLVDQSGVVCVPTGTSDPQGIYLKNMSNVCTLSSCATGYTKNGTTCNPVPPVDPFPTSITGLSGRYDVGSATASVWNDKSSNANNAPVDRGTLKVTATDVTGTKADGLKFPTAVLGTDSAYTLLYVGKYNGETKGRIFDATNNNWLSTWWATRVGVAHHNGWMTAHETGVLPNGSTELVQGTDSMGIYRLNGVDKKTAEPGAAKPTQITINSGQFVAGESSDWAMKEVIFYNRVLTIAEITQVEKYLKDKYMSSGTETYTIGDDKEIEGFTF